MRTLTVGVLVLAALLGVFLVRALVGAFVFALKAGLVLAVGAVLVYAAYELYTGWTGAG